MLVAIAIHSIFSILWKSVATVNCEYKHSIQQKKEMHTGLE